MKYVLLFQGSCGACSEVARSVRALSVPGLEARPLDDPRVLELLSDAGRQVPDRPSLLIIGDGGVEVVGGWAMRRRLVGVIGWRRAGTISRLAVAEGRARLKKSAGSPGPARRRVIGGGVAAGLFGALAWVLRSPGAKAAARQPGHAGLTVIPADSAETKALLASTAVQRAVSTWGPVSKIYTAAGHDVFVLEHSRAQVVTMVSASPADLRSGRVGAYSIGRIPGGKPGFRTYRVNGTPLTDTSTDGTVTAAYDVGDEPENVAQLLRFIACVGQPETYSCWQFCVLCVTMKGGDNCFKCAVCADIIADACAKDIYGA